MGSKSTPYRIVLAQLGVALASAAACWGIWGVSTGIAVLAGGMIGVITSLYVAARVVGRGAVRPAPQVLRRLFAAEAVKLALTIGLFAIAIGALRLSAPPLLGGYGLTLVVYWLALLPVRPRLELN